MNRRHALSLLAALPLAARLDAQTRSTARHRFAIAQTHGLLLEPDGTVKSWAYNVGQFAGEPASPKLGLGDGRPANPHVLYPVEGLANVASIAASSAASFAVLADGRVLAWGVNARGALGITPLSEFEAQAQPRASTGTPTPLAVQFDAVEVSTKGDHVLARGRDGAVFAWGYGTSGQLGIGALPIVEFRTRSARAMPEVPYPVRVPDLDAAVAIAAGETHSLALLQDGTVRAWGGNKFGQVGDGTTTNRDRPVLVPGVRNAVAIAAGGYFSVVALADGTVMEWGDIYGSPKPKTSPVPVAGVRGIRSVVAGAAHVAALTQAGGVMTWGNDSHYETGRGRNASGPGLVKELAGVTTLAAAASTTIAVLGSGRMLTWGEVRSWKRPGYPNGNNLSLVPMPLSIDGLEQP